jgi:RNA polymerase sigma-70 factor (ECF subfamily)
MQAYPKIEQSVSDDPAFDLSAFRKGDTNAFKWVYERLTKSLLYFAQNIIDSPTDAEDIVASAFLKLHRSRAEMQSYVHIRRWLYFIVRNESIDLLRYRTRSREIHEDLSYLNSEEYVDLEMLKTSLLQNLSEEIEKLPRQRKAILRLYFFEGKTTAEIAEQMQLNSQTVLNHKTRALEALRKTVLSADWLLSGVLGVFLGAAFFLLNQ